MDTIPAGTVIDAGGGAHKALNQLIEGEDFPALELLRRAYLLKGRDRMFVRNQPLYLDKARANPGHIFLLGVSKILMVLTLLALVTGCAVDYGKVRWLYVDPSLGDEDGDWWYTLNRAADMWGDAIGVPGRLRFTTDHKATPHTIRAMTMDECQDPLSGPGTYIISIKGDKICSGKAYFNPTTNTWTIGLVLDMFGPELQVTYGFTYYNRLGLAAHELGHTLWCNHVAAPDAIMYHQMRSGATLESTIITYDDLIEYYDAQDNLFPMPSDDP